MSWLYFNSLEAKLMCDVPLWLIQHILFKVAYHFFLFLPKSPGRHRQGNGILCGPNFWHSIPSDINLVQRRIICCSQRRKRNPSIFEAKSFYLKVIVTEHNFLRRKLCCLKCLRQDSSEGRVNCILSVIGLQVVKDTG